MLNNNIPKRIFFYWGGENMSWMRYMTLYSFRKMNPEWEMILYISKMDIKDKMWKGSEEQDFSNYIGDNYFSKIKDLNIKIKIVNLPNNIKKNVKIISPVHESDLFRYYELNKNGGFYSDMDILFFKPMDELYNDIINHNTDVLLYQGVSYVAIGFLGAKKKNQYFLDLLNYSKIANHHDDYQSYGVDLMYKMFNQNRNNPIIINSMKTFYKNMNFYNLSKDNFYYYDWLRIYDNYHNPFGIDTFPKNAIGYHWYGGSPISQKYNNLLNENNYKDYRITFSEVADYILKIN
jgi:hypothetical protein